MTESKRNRLWPSVNTIDEAKKASMAGVWAAGYSVVVISLVASWSLWTGEKAFEIVDAWAFIDAFLFALIALGIYKEYRPAAVIGFVVFFYEKLDLFLRTGKVPGPIVALFLLLAYFQSVRALFALHRLRKAAVASTEAAVDPT